MELFQAPQLVIHHAQQARHLLQRLSLGLTLSFVCLGSSVHGADSVNTDMNELVQQIRQLDDLSKLVQKEFIKPISREELWNGAIRGMVESLDTHCQYFTKDETALYAGNQADRGRGFGFDWNMNHEKNIVNIARVIPGSNAEKHGLCAGDVLLSINDQEVSEITRNQIREIFVHALEKISLSARQADGNILKIDLERSDFVDSGVLEPHMLAKNIGYIRISRFRDIGGDSKTEKLEGVAQTLTGKTFRQHLDVLSTKELKALIIDLRGNGGGSIRAAVEVADCFLNSGPNDPRVIVEQVSRNNIGRSFSYTASSVNTFPHWPICVLIDENTASSAEIVAAALQDYKRAIIVGTPSTGKTSIQETFLLNDGSSIRLSVANYQTPNGQNIDGIGLQPDIECKQSPLNQLLVHRKHILSQNADPIPEELVPIQDTVIKQAIDILVGILVYHED